MNSVAQIYFNDKDLGQRWAEVKEDFWGDLKKETLIALKRLLETTMEVQVQDLIGCDKGEHYEYRKTYRNGYRPRSVLSSFGYISNIQVPRLREGMVKFNCLQTGK